MAYNVDYTPMVQASGRRAQAMTGLGGVLGGAIKGGLDKRQGRADVENLRGLSERARAGDVGAQDELSRVAPEINQQIMGRIGADTEQKQKGLIYDLANTISLHQAGNQQGALDNLDQRIKVVGARGGDTTQTQQVRDMYAANPEQGAAYLSKSIQHLVDQKEFAKGLSPKAAGEGPQHQKTGAFLVRNKETGESEIAVGDFNPADGSLTTKVSKFENHEVLSKLGETAAEGTTRKVGEKRDITREVGKEKRASELVDRGLLAAESTAILRRGIELLNTVETGGIDAVAFHAKRIFGVEGADAGELSRSMGKAVLSQLRDTFGAQFTKEEGDRLIRLEAGFGKSLANNKRILDQTLKIVERTARRASKAAERRGDTETVEDIENLMAFSLSLDAPGGGAAKSVGDMSDEELRGVLGGGR